MTSYFENLTSAMTQVVKVLENKGVQDHHLMFGGPGSEPTKAPRAPTDARSEFLANRAMGDWAENLLADALRKSVNEWSISHFGATDSIAAGHVDFKEHYLSSLKEVRDFGKRPDLLIFDKTKEKAVPDNLSILPFSTIDPLASLALASIEVRSSKFEALKYMAVRRQQKEAGVAAAREAPSFTVKVEDLVIVYRWLERKRIPQVYFQVFFDSVFAINVLDIFQLIGGWKKGSTIKFETPEKSQEKATIMIPITFGTQVGTISTLPQFTVEHKVTVLGRHDAYVKPIGGELTLDAAKVRTVLFR
jgi:hypothetical protein